MKCHQHGIPIAKPKPECVCVLDQKGEKRKMTKKLKAKTFEKVGKERTEPSSSMDTIASCSCRFVKRFPAVAQSSSTSPSSNVPDLSTSIWSKSRLCRANQKRFLF